jgi:hypothetical protein
VLGTDLVNVDRYVVCGDMSGGALVTLMGHHFNASPKAIIDVFGVVDFESMGWLKDEPEDQLTPNENSKWKGEITEAELADFLINSDPANALDAAPPRNGRYTEEQSNEQWGARFRHTRRV